LAQLFLKVIGITKKKDPSIAFGESEIFGIFHNGGIFR
jgi:hypothetical protein